VAVTYRKSRARMWFAQGVFMTLKMASKTCSKYALRFLALSLSFAIVGTAAGYDSPLSEIAIRDAYFLGNKAGQGGAFLAEYNRAIPELKAGSCVSGVRVETPFAHVAVHASQAHNYSAQDAVKEFFGKPAFFRIHLEICYEVGAPENSIRIKVVQNKKSIQWSSESRSAYYPLADELTQVSNNGERIDLEFPAERLESSELAIRIDTPDAQHAETLLPLQTLR